MGVDLCEDRNVAKKKMVQSHSDCNSNWDVFDCNFEITKKMELMEQNHHHHYHRNPNSDYTDYLVVVTMKQAVSGFYLKMLQTMIVEETACTMP